MNDPFARPYPDGCLSAFRVSRAALDELTDDERPTVDAHLASCPRCAERVADERASVAAATLEPLPAALRPAPARAPRGFRSSRWTRWAAPLVAMAASAVVAVIALPREESGIHLKGGVAIEATVVRGDRTVVADTPLDRLGPLADGDRMRLRVRAGAGRQARVEGLDGGDWVGVWDGTVPEDGWLPFGLTASAGSETALRVALCPSGRAIPAEVFAAAAPPEGCTLRTWILDVR